MFLANPNGKDIEEFMKTDWEIREDMDVLYKIRGDKETMMLAEMREKAIINEQSRLNKARKEGIEKENSILRDVERVLKLITKKFVTLNNLFLNKRSHIWWKNINGGIVHL